MEIFSDSWTEVPLLLLRSFGEEKEEENCEQKTAKADWGSCKRFLKTDEVDKSIEGDCVEEVDEVEEEDVLDRPKSEWSTKGFQTLSNWRTANSSIFLFLNIIALLCKSEKKKDRRNRNDHVIVDVK